MNKYFNVFNVFAAVEPATTVAISIGALRSFRKIMKGVDNLVEK